MARGLQVKENVCLLGVGLGGRGVFLCLKEGTEVFVKSERGGPRYFLV